MVFLLKLIGKINSINVSPTVKLSISSMTPTQLGYIALLTSRFLFVWRLHEIINTC